MLPAQPSCGEHREVVATHRAATRALRALADAAAALATRAPVSRHAQARLDRRGRGGVPRRGGRARSHAPAAELSRMSAQLRSLDTQRDQAEALLTQPDVAASEQQPAPDLDALAGAAAAAREAARTPGAPSPRRVGGAGAIHELHDEVLAIVARIGPAEAEQAVVQELADCVGGTSGNNALRMRLSSYRPGGAAGGGRDAWPTSGCR